MKQQVVIEPNAVRRVERILRRLPVQSVFLVTGKASYARSGAAAVLDRLAGEFEVSRFCDFEQNPKLSDVEKGLASFRRGKFDTVLAVGGGSVIDMAKLIAILSANEGSPERLLCEGRRLIRDAPPLVAVPTTAGSGSEATHFAVVYHRGKKYSVVHKSILPARAVVDPNLTAAMPPELAAVTGLDAFSQAVESLWSVGATDPSRAWAAEAIRLALAHLVDATHRPTPVSRLGMCRAAHLAGKAINVTRTTAPHALSYTMTSLFGVPHGHAVAVTLGQTLLFNSGMTENDANDPRGAGYVKERIDELNRLLGCRTAAESCARIKNLIRQVGLPTRLGDLGIRTAEDRRRIVANVNVERLGNNPRSMTREQLRSILDAVA